MASVSSNLKMYSEMLHLFKKNEIALMSYKKLLIFYFSFSVKVPNWRVTVIDKDRLRIRRHFSS